MSCMSDIISLAFSFHTPTFFAKVRISWNSWPLFSCWLRVSDVRFRLWSRVCVCLFCSVVVVLFVVGRQQHCRYIVIDAMVYPKNWSLEDKFGTGKTSGVFGLNLVFLHLVFATEKILNLEVTTLCMNRTRWALDDALSSTLCFGRRVLRWLSFDHECDLEHEHFSADHRILLVSVHDSDVSGWDVMSKGGMEIWHPVGAPLG